MAIHINHLLRKQPLDSAMAQRSRRRRVAPKREVFGQWAEEEGVTVTALLGFLLFRMHYTHVLAQVTLLIKGHGHFLSRTLDL